MTTAAAGALACAGVIAAVPASAADKMSVGVGGYMEQWVGYANMDDLYDKSGKMTQESAIDIQSDSEIFFTGSLESDMGLKFGVDVQLEGNANDKSVIDESFAWVSGEFGRLEIGARDAIHARTHYGISDVGVLLNAGDTQKWIPGAYLDTNGWIADNKNLIYITPRVSGVQVGLSYGSDGTNEYKGQAKNNDNAVWAAGINFNQAVNDATFKISAGHRNASMASSEIKYMTGMGPGVGGGDDMRITTSALTAHKAAWERWEYLASTNAKNKEKMLAGADDAAQAASLAGIVDAGLMGRTAIGGATDGMVKKGGDDTFTNFGIGVGFGGFTFNVAYAMRDKGTYTTTAMNVPVTVAEVTAIAADAEDDRFPTTASMTADGVYVDTAHTWDADGDPATAATAEATDSNDPSNDNPMWAGQKVVKNKADEWDVWGASVAYADGPMAVSLGHMVHETDAGTERTATMLSVKYTLAPGVDWRSSIMMVEDDTAARYNKDGEMRAAEGTAFVTGLKIGF